MSRSENIAREFVETGFRSLGVPSLEPYIKIIAELIEFAIVEERERCAKVAVAAIRQGSTDNIEPPDAMTAS
jgi:hypothetical protein